MVLSPFRAASATWALNAAEWLFRLPAIGSPFLDRRCSLTGGPVFGVHYNGYRADLLVALGGVPLFDLRPRSDQAVQVGVTSAASSGLRPAGASGCPRCGSSRPACCRSGGPSIR